MSIEYVPGLAGAPAAKSYKVKDPRAYILQRLAEQLFDRMGIQRG